MDDAHPLILFDGVCGLCDRLVNFVIARDPHGRFHFAPLQSPLAQQLIGSSSDAGPPDLSTVVLIDGAGVHRQSTAALRILLRLSKPLALAGRVGLWFPRPLRDMVYRWIARNRYRWFGRRDACRVPTVETANRFLA